MNFLLFLDVPPVPAPVPGVGGLILLAFMVVGLVAILVIGFVFLLKRRRPRGILPEFESSTAATQPSSPNQR